MPTRSLSADRAAPRGHGGPGTVHQSKSRGRLCPPYSAPRQPYRGREQPSPGTFSGKLPQRARFSMNRLRRPLLVDTPGGPCGRSRKGCARKGIGPRWPIESGSRRGEEAIVHQYQSSSQSRTAHDTKELRAAILVKPTHAAGKDVSSASDLDWFVATALAARDPTPSTAGRTPPAGAEAGQERAFIISPSNISLDVCSSTH